MGRTDPVSRERRYRWVLLVWFATDRRFGLESAITWGLDWFERRIEQVEQALHVLDGFAPAIG